MKFLFEFLPIILFFIAYKIAGIYVATVVAIIASFIQIGLYWYKNRRFENMHLVTLVLITILGGATLLLHNPMFIKWKPTIVNWAFAIAFLCSSWIGKKPIIQRMIGSQIELPVKIWHRLNISWVIFFILLGLVNLFVVYHFNTNVWVNFKLFGMLGLTTLFVILQAFYLARHIQQEPQKK